MTITYVYLVLICDSTITTLTDLGSFFLLCYKFWVIVDLNLQMGALEPPLGLNPLHFATIKRH